MESKQVCLSTRSWRRGRGPPRGGRAASSVEGKSDVDGASPSSRSDVAERPAPRSCGVDDDGAHQLCIPREPGRGRPPKADAMPARLVERTPPRISGCQASVAGVQLDFIRPGKPRENASIESFNGRLRDECLNVHQFLSWTTRGSRSKPGVATYNETRPHSSLGRLTPCEFVIHRQATRPIEAGANLQLSGVRFWVRRQGCLRDGRGPCTESIRALRRGTSER